MVNNVLTKLNDLVNVYQFYQTGRYVTGIIISVILVKSGLSGTDLGQFEILMFMALTVSFFWTVGFQNALLSYYPTCDDDKKESVLTSAFIILMILGSLIAIIFLLAPNFLMNLFKEGGDTGYFPMLALYIWVSSPLLMIENVLLLKKMGRKLLKYTIVGLSFTIVLMTSISIFAPAIENFFMGLISIAIIKLIYLILLLNFKVKMIPDKKVMMSFLIFSAPLILNVLISSMMDVVDGWFVSRYYSQADFAVFRYGARELPFSSVLYSSLSAALIPYLSTQEAQFIKLKENATKWMHVLFPASIILCFVSPLIFSLIYNPTFKTSAFIFNIYLLILISRVLLPQTYNFAKHQHKVVVWSGIMELLCNIALSYWWMHIWGIYGLAMATVVSYFIQKLILITYNRINDGIRFHDYIDIKYYLLYSVALVSSLYLSFKIYS